MQLMEQRLPLLVVIVVSLHSFVRPRTRYFSARLLKFDFWTGLERIPPIIPNDRCDGRPEIDFTFQSESAFGGSVGRRGGDDGGRGGGSGGEVEGGATDGLAGRG